MSPKPSMLFNSVKMQAPPSSKFDLSHQKKLSCNMGDLVPIMIQEVLPGDKFRVNSEILMRLAPMLAPVMHYIDVWVHSYFVPDRIIWNEFEPWITGGEDGTEAPVFPQMIFNTDFLNTSLAQPGQLMDFLGFPTFPASDTGPVTNPQNFSLMPFRAYQMIYNEYYRDQNLQPKIDFSLASGIFPYSDAIPLMSMRKRCWEKDYFTSALPFAQRGPEVSIPIGVNYSDISIFRDASGAPPVGLADITTNGTGTPPGDIGTAFDGPGRIENIESIAEPTINELRYSFRLQEWLEKAARGGSRYIEQNRSFFNVMSSDARLQRPEYIGGGKAPVVISEVLSTFQEGDDTGNPQGTMAGHGVSVGNLNKFSYTAEEHGQIITIMSILPRTNYQQGLPKMWQRFNKLDRYWPPFANLGEQEVKGKELFYDWDDSAGESTFGYQSRYAEYKYCPSTVHGSFKTSLSYWHMGRIFETKPLLNSDFVSADPTFRIFAVEDPDIEHLYCNIYHHVSAIRPMPFYGTPSF